MSIQSEITRITGKRDESFVKVQSKGVMVPSGANINDLPGLIELIDINPNYVQTGDATLDENDIIVFDSGGGSLTVTDNGTYNISQYDTVVVAIPAASGVNF